MTKEEFINKWGYRTLEGFGGALYDLRDELIKDLNNLSLQSSEGKNVVCDKCGYPMFYHKPDDIMCCHGCNNKKSTKLSTLTEQPKQDSFAEDWNKEDNTYWASYMQPKQEPMIVCPDCNGRGTRLLAHFAPRIHCDRCNGTGKIIANQ